MYEYFDYLYRLQKVIIKKQVVSRYFFVFFKIFRTDKSVVFTYFCVITMVCIYRLLRTIYIGVSPKSAVIISFLLMIFPYEIGLLTYLCMDAHTTFFLIWLICSYKNRNHILVGFCGYLLAFNKITGLVFYVVFLICAGLFELRNTQKERIWQKIKIWWNYSTVILWFTPAVLFIASFFIANYVTVQVFYGSNSASPFGDKLLISMLNTIFQSFIFGFRWVIMLLFIVALLLAFLKKKKLTAVLTREGQLLFLLVTVSCLSVFIMLMIYRGDAECPRYTALFNTFYILAIPFSIHLLSERKEIRSSILVLLSIIMSVQLFWTIDPSIIMKNDSLYSGQKEIYKLSLPNDPRPSMGLGAYFGRGYQVYGDLYVYNLEYTFQDDLLDRILDGIDPDEKTEIVLLDVIDYEFHISGAYNHYPIYWNTRERHRTYDGQDKDSIFLKNVNSFSTDEIVSHKLKKLNDFYLIVPARVKILEARIALARQGYECYYKSFQENQYGSISVYGFKKVTKVK